MFYLLQNEQSSGRIVLNIAKFDVNQLKFSEMKSNFNHQEIDIISPGNSCKHITSIFVAGHSKRVAGGLCAVVSHASYMTWPVDTKSSFVTCLMLCGRHFPLRIRTISPSFVVVNLRSSYTVELTIWK